MNNKTHILVVEDEEHIARGVVFNLEEEGYRVTHVLSGEEALEVAWNEALALVILDLMLPGMDGFEVCERLRQNDPQLPILMLTARTEEKDRIEGLMYGADDYLTKPFSLDELLLRVKGMLRRSSWYRSERGSEQSFRFDGNEVNLEERTAKTPRGEIELTELEARMLRTFFRHEGSTLSRQALLTAVWGVKPDTETRTLDNFIVRLRRYFEDDPTDPQHFLTVRGRGYRFVKNP